MKTIIKNTLPLLFLAALASCGDKDADQAAAAQQGQQAPSVPAIKVETRTVTSYTDYPATIEGTTNSEVRAKISGYITDVLVDEGQKVRKGQKLFKLETQTLNQDAAAAKANVNAAQVEVDKLKPLVDKNIISNVQLETAKAKLQQAKSGYSGIAANIGYGTITSPVDGYVGTIRFRKGSLVSPSAEPLTTVSAVENVYAYFSMNESEYLTFLQNADGSSKEEKIKNYPEVSLVLANGTEYSEKGKIETINSQINSRTGTVTFRALFANPTGLLSAGNSGTIKVPKVFTDAVVVPQESTFEQQGKRYVYKISQDTTAVSQSIQVISESNNVYVIKEGISEGDVIVGKGMGKLRNDMKIKPQMTAFDSIAKPITTEFQLKK
ncbi:efflux RND transporter periplasmic adaptor subunit [Nonlabens antarcticus]|uniref:efflux RND transporter periplasmic adaptor subunit n=1 Tax=Nonlabens antarcticus TaxID=392714 RepID=UPI001891B6AB|nr:efflux RND transporter periplasmic adaptor subunit [Nonlabens antarcticus]